MADNILSDFGIDILEEEIDDVIFQTNEFLCDATFTGSQGPFWWILQMCMALAALFSIIVAANMAYKMMVKHEPLDVMKLFKPLAIAIILSWWYPPADTGMNRSGSSWCVLDFLSYIPNAIGSYTHDLYQAEATQISDKFQEVQELIYVRDTMYTSLQAQADVAHSGVSDPNLIESTMEQTGVDEVTMMHGWIIRYLYENREQDIFQKDIEQRFAVGRSTVTNLIQLMEKKGFVKRESVKQDARLKKVILTEKGIASQESFEDIVEHIEEELSEGISEEDRKSVV